MTSSLKDDRLYDISSEEKENLTYVLINLNKAVCTTMARVQVGSSDWCIESERDCIEHLTEFSKQLKVVTTRHKVLEEPPTAKDIGLYVKAFIGEIETKSYPTHYTPKRAALEALKALWTDIESGLSLEKLLEEFAEGEGS